MKKLILIFGVISILFSCSVESERKENQRLDSLGKVAVLKEKKDSLILDSLNDYYVKKGFIDYCDASLKYDVAEFNSIGKANKKYGKQNQGTNLYEKFRISAHNSAVIAINKKHNIPSGRFEKDKKFMELKNLTDCSIENKLAIGLVKYDNGIEVSTEKTSTEVKSDYSVEALRRANDRVEKWQLRGHLKLDINAGKAYINSLLWNVANVEQKTEIMATVMMYTEDKYGLEERITRFYNYNTGKQIAEWGPIGGYDFDY